MKTFNDGITSPWQETFLMLAAYLYAPSSLNRSIMQAVCAKLGEHFGKEMVSGFASREDQSVAIPKTRLEQVVCEKQIELLPSDCTSIVLDCVRTAPRDPLGVPVSARWWDIQFRSMQRTYAEAPPYAVIDVSINTQKLEPVPMD